ncbi:MAG: hypothetical protein FD167_1596 [bacterium]|nr:MAG: hypothetical protein FD167_1596 [bacterium]
MELETNVGYNPTNMEIKLNIPTITIPPLPKINLAKLCLDLRKLLGLSRQEMAALLEVSEDTYESYELNRRKPNGHSTAKLFLIREKYACQFIELEIDPEASNNQ